MSESMGPVGGFSSSAGSYRIPYTYEEIMENIPKRSAKSISRSVSPGLNLTRTQIQASEREIVGKGAGNGAAKLTGRDITFSDKFSKPAYKNQVADRGWTNDSIADARNNPVKIGTSKNPYTGNDVTLYYVDDVHYVAVDNGTGKVIQVADLNKADWKMDLTK
ncbi:colicin E5-related ribonuclease [Paenibacillus pinistramenti]|uniref:colicin E5-related ribonuclease n=1 Tax=Paenibacillus pinistramenti TaxID=1768003 RepID=UPI001396972C|nr:colicin E5-related ribonuclease [Paenibacillus pinistramenti]